VHPSHTSSPHCPEPPPLCRMYHTRHAIRHSGANESAMIVFARQGRAGFPAIHEHRRFATNHRPPDEPLLEEEARHWRDECIGLRARSNSSNVPGRATPWPDAWRSKNGMAAGYSFTSQEQKGRLAAYMSRPKSRRDSIARRSSKSCSSHARHPALARIEAQLMPFSGRWTPRSRPGISPLHAPVHVTGLAQAAGKRTRRLGGHADQPLMTLL